MKLYLKLLNGDLIDFGVNIESILSDEKYEKECRTHVLTCAPKKACEKMSQSFLSYVDVAKDLGYTHKVHVYRNIKIQFIRSLRHFSSKMKVLTNQCYVSFLDNENSYELFKDNIMVDTSFADLILSKKIVEESILCISILPIYHLETVSMEELLIYLEMNKYELDDNSIIWVKQVGNCLIATMYKKDDKSFKFVIYYNKNDILLEKCIDIAKYCLERLEL